MVISPRSAQPVMVSSRFRRSRCRSTVARLRSLWAAISPACSLVPSGSCPLSERTSRSVSSWRAMSKGGEAAPVDIGAHQRPQLGELIRIPADFTGDGGLAQLPGGHHPAVSADDAPCVLAVGRDHDVLQKAVLLHGAHGGKELIVLRHGEAVHGVIHQRRHRQLAGQLTVDGAGVFRCLCRVEKIEGLFLPAMDQPSILASISSHRAA